MLWGWSVYEFRAATPRLPFPDYLLVGFCPQKGQRKSTPVEQAYQAQFHERNIHAARVHDGISYGSFLSWSAGVLHTFL